MTLTCSVAVKSLETLTTGELCVPGSRSPFEVRAVFLCQHYYDFTAEKFFLFFCCDVLVSKCPQLLLHCLSLTLIGQLNLDPSGLDNRCVLGSLGCSRFLKEAKRF